MRRKEEAKSSMHNFYPALLDDSVLRGLQVGFRSRISSCFLLQHDAWWEVFLTGSHSIVSTVKADVS
jgi:hypothetical protein